MWKVTATLKSPGNAPVDMVWQREGTEMGAIVSVSQLFEHDTKDKGQYTPALLAIKIEKV
jgi:hypothetical protein